MQSGDLFGPVIVPLVDGNDAACGAGDVVEDLLSDVDRNVERSQPGGKCAPEVVQRPVSDAAQLVEARFAL